MRNLSLKAALLAAATAVGLTSSAHAQYVNIPSGPGPYPGGAPWAEAWAGFGGQNNWYGGWAGFNYAFNHNVYSSGFVLRGEGGGGHYDYNSGANSAARWPGGFVNATYGTGALMLGYRMALQNVVGQTTLISGYIGAEVQDVNNPDPTADVRGTEWGVKVLGDIYERWNAYQDLYAMASFSSAFDTWQIIARPGFLVTSPTSFQVWVGPDLGVFANGHAWGHSNSASCPQFSSGGGGSGGIGSCHYEQGRIGGFVHFVNPGWTVLGDVLVSGGYQQPMASNSGPHGYYAQIGLYWPIR